MPSKDLFDTVHYHLSQGETKESIKDFLLSEGWQEQAIDEVFGEIPKPPPFWQQLPFYPKTRKLYDYMIVGGGSQFKLCIYYETKSQSSDCFNSQTIDVGPAVISR